MTGKRRPRGDGSVYKRASDGRWVVDVPLGMLTLPNGKRKRDRATDYFPTEHEAEAERRRLLYERDQGRLIAGNPGHMSVEKYLHYWLEHAAPNSRKVRTVEHYRGHIRVHLIPALGSHRLDKLGPEHIQRMLNERHKEGYKRRSLGNIRACLSAALQQAVKWRWLTYNAARLADIPKDAQGYEEARVQYLEEHEVAALLNKARGTPYEALFWLACGTGMRVGELLGLKWVDIDFRNQMLRIRRQWVVLGGKYVYDTPKNLQSGGVVYIPPVCIPILLAQRARQAIDRKAVGHRWHDMDAVFTNSVGKPLYRSLINYHLKCMITELGIEKHISIHALRHTYATMLFADNTDLKVVSEMLRHATVATTAGVYVHVIPRLKSQAVGKINRLLGGS